MEEQASSGQSGLPGTEQWLSFRQKTGMERGDKISSVLGSGALQLIRTRSSIRRELKRHTNQSKSGDALGTNENGNGGGGGGLGKWLREHLGGSRGSHEVNGSSNGKRTASSQVVDGVHLSSEKSTPRLTYASQNLYCSLPRENGRGSHEDGNTRGNGNGQPQNRPRSNSANFHARNATTIMQTDAGGQLWRRGVPIYSSDGKSMRRRNRDRRRHSLNEVQDDDATHRNRLFEMLTQTSHRREKLFSVAREIEDEKETSTAIGELANVHRERLARAKIRLSKRRGWYRAKMEASGLLAAPP